MIPFSGLRGRGSWRVRGPQATTVDDCKRSRREPQPPSTPGPGIGDSHLTLGGIGPTLRAVVDQSDVALRMTHWRRFQMRIRNPQTAPNRLFRDASRSPGVLNVTFRFGAHGQSSGSVFDHYGIEQGLAHHDVRLVPDALSRLSHGSDLRERSFTCPDPRCHRNTNPRIVTDTHVRHINARWDLEPPGRSGSSPPGRQKLPRQQQQ